LAVVKLLKKLVGSLAISAGVRLVMEAMKQKILARMTHTPMGCWGFPAITTTGNASADAPGIGEKS
jgi:hypothetical protein